MKRRLFADIVRRAFTLLTPGSGWLTGSARTATARQFLNTALTLTDAKASGPTALTAYDTRLTCTNAFTGPGATPSAGLPSNLITATTSITPAPDDDITCTFTNTVLMPLLPVTKTTSPVITSTNPGQTVTYTSVTTNSGPGAATIVELTDTLSPYTAWGINSFGPLVAFQFVDGPSYGAAASGVTLGTAVYSNDKGVSWSYSPSSTGGGAPAGYDANVTNWKIPMNGTMTGWTGSPNPKPSFTINYKVLV